MTRKQQTWKVYGKFKSSSHPTRRYTVLVSRATGEAWCECPGYYYRGRCKHTARVYERSTSRG